MSRPHHTVPPLLSTQLTIPTPACVSTSDLAAPAKRCKARVKLRLTARRCMSISGDDVILAQLPQSAMPPKQAKKVTTAAAAAPPTRHALHHPFVCLLPCA